MSAAPPASPTPREARLAAALRLNLRRRKGVEVSGAPVQLGRDPGPASAPDPVEGSETG